MPELCLGKLVCKMLKAVARVTVAPMSAAFFCIYHAPSSDSSCQVGLMSSFTFTGEGTECQLSQGQCWACSWGLAPAVLGKTGGQQQRDMCLGTENHIT